MGTSVRVSPWRGNAEKTEGIQRAASHSVVLMSLADGTLGADANDPPRGDQCGHRPVWSDQLPLDCSEVRSPCQRACCEFGKLALRCN